MAEDLRVPCELPADGEIKVEELGPNGIFADCKIDWDKQPAPYFSINYSDDVKYQKESPKMPVNPPALNIEPPKSVVMPVAPPVVEHKTSVGVPDHLPIKKSDLAHKAADPAATAAIVASLAGAASSMAMSAVMKSPPVKKAITEANKVLHKLSKGKLGKKEQPKEEKKEEQGGDCKTHQIQCNAANAALKAQIAGLEARMSSDSVVVTDGPTLNESLEELVERIEKLEKVAKQKKTTKTKKA